MTEQVGAVPRSHLDSLGWLTHGCATLPPHALATVEAQLVWLPRPAAEQDPMHKQIIPYCLIRRGDSYFACERLGGSGEARLHGKISLGIGGHLNPDGAANDGAVVRGLLREWAEEVQGAQPLRPPAAVGLVNDDSNEVGRVHWGLVFVAELASDAQLSVRETDKLAGGFRSLPWLRERRERMETWSRLCFDALIDGPSGPELAR